MQKVMFKFLLFSLLVLIFISCSNIDSSKYLCNWVGNYSYEEEPRKANADYYMAMAWTLSINNNSDTCQNVLEVNGQQTYIKLLTDISGDTNTIAIKYNKLIEGSDEHLKKGDTLFTLSKRAGKLITKWLTFEPRLLDNQPKECNCFIQSKN
jgi:sulfur carrier protein ThiS